MFVGDVHRYSDRHQLRYTDYANRNCNLHFQSVERCRRRLVLDKHLRPYGHRNVLSDRDRDDCWWGHTAHDLRW